MVGDYIRGLRIKVVFDETRHGQIYILDEKSVSILFIFDVIDECLYINQDIIDDLGENEIRKYLDFYSIGFAIFPYYSEEGDVEKLKPSMNKGIAYLSERVNEFSIYESSIEFYDGISQLISIINFNYRNIYVSYSLTYGRKSLYKHFGYEF